jgi:hypothetical protein
LRAAALLIVVWPTAALTAALLTAALAATFLAALLTAALTATLLAALLTAALLGAQLTGAIIVIEILVVAFWIHWIFHGEIPCVEKRFPLVDAAPDRPADQAAAHCTRCRLPPTLQTNC